MNMITAYYHITCDILKDYIPCKPELKLTNAKNYMGQIKISNDGIVIRISKWNHIDNEYLMDEEDRNDIIDTICHELAHMHYIKHGEDHTHMTELYKTVVMNQLEVKRLEALLAS